MLTQAYSNYCYTEKVSLINKQRKVVKNMKKIFSLVAIAILFGLVSSPVMAAKPAEACATIQGGTITDAKGGYYDNYSRPDELVTSGDKLIMQWSDAWIANVDCDRDGKLDRGLVDGQLTDGVSKGWLTNHYTGEYTDENGKVQHFTDFVKIVWTGPGSSLWGQYEIVQEVWNDKAGGYSGLFSKLGSPGFGLNNQWTVLP